MSMLINPYAYVPLGVWSSWSPTDKTATLTVSDSNRLATATSGGTSLRSIRGAHALPTTGKYYFEFVNAVYTVSTGTMAFGLSDGTLNVSTQYIGQTANSWALWGQYGSSTLRKFNNNVFGSLSGTLATGSVIGIAVDMTTGHLWFSLNGTFLEGNPAAGTGASYTNLSGKGLLYPASSIYLINDAIRLRSNPTEFTYAPPSGFTGGIPG